MLCSAILRIFNTAHSWVAKKEHRLLHTKTNIRIFAHSIHKHKLKHTCKTLRTLLKYPQQKDCWLYPHSCFSCAFIWSQALL